LKAAEQLQAKARAAQAKAAAELARQAPRSTLKTWLRKGVIDKGLFRERMHLLNLPDDVIDHTIAEVCDGKPGHCGAPPAPPKAAKPPKPAAPSLAAFKGWMKKGIIAIEEYVDLMRARGMEDRFIGDEIADACGSKNANCTSDGRGGWPQPETPPSAGG
jgi:hypothetical protein